MTKKTTHKPAKKVAKKKPVKKADVITDVVTEYDMYITSYEPKLPKNELRKSYWRLAVAYFKGWLNTFR